MKGKCKDELQGLDSADQSTWAQVQGPCIREATVWASRTLRVGSGMGARQGFPAHAVPGFVLAGWTSVGTACLYGGALGPPSSAGMAVVRREVALL